MKITIKKGIPEYNKGRYPDNKKKVCVWVEFPNCISTTTKRPFKWFPTYEQLIKIIQRLKEVEQESWGYKKNV